jgi:ankyrin repeat protein
MKGVCCLSSAVFWVLLNSPAKAQPVAQVLAQRSTTQESATASVKEESLLLDAVRNGDVASVKKRLAQGDSANTKTSDGLPALHLAVVNGNLSVVRTLLDAGASPNAQMTNGWTAFTLALSTKKTDIAKLLIERGADVNAPGDGMTPLQIAEQLGQPDLAQVIKRAGGKVPPVTLVEPATPEILAKAALASDTERVKILLTHGVDPNTADADGWTPLMFAAFGGSAETVRALTSAKAHVNIQAKDGMTPLMVAVMGGDSATVNALVAAGADVSTTTKDGVSAEVIAKQYGFSDIERFLAGKTQHAPASRPQTAAFAPSPTYTPPDPSTRLTQMTQELGKRFPRLRIDRQGGTVTFSGEVPSQPAYEEISRLARELGREFSLVTTVDLRYPKESR